MTNEEYFAQTFPSLVNADAFAIGNRRFVSMDKVLEIVHELEQENIGRDGSHEYESACKDFRAAVEALKGEEQE